MSKDSGRLNTEGEKSSFKADTKNIIKTEEDLKDLDVERKDQYLERMKVEDAANANNFKIIDEWVEVVGKKVIRLYKNKIGSVHSMYLFNGKRYPEDLKIMKAQGFFTYSEGEGPQRKIPLKVVNGRPFKMKAA
jgi:hypothetical protein